MGEPTGSFSSMIADVFAFAYVLAIIFAPILLGFACFKAYVTWKRNKFIASQKKFVLEIKLPKEMTKGPLAMELFLTSLYQTKGESTWIARLVDGKVRPWFSLELVSIGGDIKFFIWTWEFWKKQVTSQLFAQFPDIEVKEVDDYASKFHFNPRENDLWGTHFKLSKADFYPIKSYADYLLDKDPKEEFKVDPMTAVIEYLGSLQRGEQAWIQIIIRAHKKELSDHETLFGKVDWTHGAKKEIDKIKTKDTQQLDTVKLTGLSLTKGEKDVIEAIEHNISKLPFDCGIRVIYSAEKDKFNEMNVAGLNGSFRQYNSNSLNSFETDHTTSFDYPWQDWTGKKLLHKKEHILHTYQSRSFFHEPDKGHFFVLNTESLATLFHFPGQVSKTPTLERSSAKKSEPPSNLPI